ncbi:MAG TPA: hypothetical protein VIX59_20115 [Candidatus Binataceae bacterium]
MPRSGARRGCHRGAMRATLVRVTARTVILWLHVLSGAVWIGAAACFVIAALALAAGSDEQCDFAARVAPRIVALSVGAAGLLLVTGALNFTLAGIARRFHFSMAFGAILAAKVVLFIAMAAALAAASRTSAAVRAALEHPRGASPGGAAPPGDAPRDAVANAINGMMKSEGAIVALGGLALVLGLWLAGT